MNTFVPLPFSFCHCIVCPSIYAFWLPLWYLQASLCPFALFILSLYCLSFSNLRLLITSLVSSSFSLSVCPLHVVIVLSVLLLFTASDYLFGIFKLLFVLLPFSFCHCIVCSSIYGFWLPLLYLQASLCPFALFILSLYCLSFFYLRLLITSFVPSSFSLSLCPFSFVIVLSVLLLFTASDYLFGTFKLLFVLLPFSFCHCIVCPSSIYGFWLPLLYLQASLCPFALFILSLYCLSFFYLRFLITPFVPSSFSLSFCPFHFVIVLSVLLLFTAADYLFGIFKPLVVLLPFSFCHCIVCPSIYASDYLFGIFKLLFVLLPFFFCHCIVCPSIYGFWLPLWYLQASLVLLPFSFCHCIVCPSSIYGFWLPLWYLQASLCPFALFILSLYCLSFFYLRFLITSLVPSSFSLSLCRFSFVIVLSVLLLFTPSDYLFGIFKPLFVLLPFSVCHCIVCPSPIYASDYLFGVFKLLFVLLPFSFCHCIVCPSIYGFWLPLCYLQASLCPFALFSLSLYCLSFSYLRLLITSLVSSSFSLSFCPFSFVIVLSVLLFTASDYLFGIYKPLFVLLPFSFCHCIVCPSSIYGFWFPLWYLQASLCPFALFILSLYCLSFFYLRFLITSLVPSSFSLSLCPFSFIIVLSVLLLFTASDYLFCTFKLLFVPLPFFFCHCIVCPSSIYGFWLPLCTFKLLFVPLPFSFCHCIVCPSSIYGFWLPLWYLQASVCPFALFILSLYCLSFLYLRLLITSLVSSSFSLSFCLFSFVIVLSVRLLFTVSDYLFCTFKLLFVLLPFSFCHCIVCPSSIYGFWLPLWYLQASLCPFALFILSLYCLSFFYLRLLITSFVPSSFSLSFCPFHFVIVLSVLLLFTASDYLFCTFKLLFVLLPFSFCHCIVCPSSIYGFWLPLWYLQASVCPFALFILSLYCLSFFYLRFWLPLWYLQASLCHFALFILSLYCLSFFYLRLLITSLVPSSFCLSLCPFSFVIVLSVLLFTASDYLFGIFKLLFVLLPFSFCHCIVCSSIYGFWLPLLYLQASLCPFALFILSLYCLSFFYLRFLITSFVPSSFSLSFCPFHFVIVLSVLLLFTASDYLFGIFKLLFVLLPFSFCHCIVCSSIYGFWLPLLYLQASLCPFALFILSLYCLSFFYLRLLITSFVPSSFSLSLCPFSFVIVLSVLLLFTASDYLFGTFKLLFVLSPFSFCHCIVCPSSIYGFWLPLLYLQASLCPFALFILLLYCLSFFYLRFLITPFVPSSFSLSFCPFHFVIVLSVLLLFTASDYLFGTFKLLFVLLPFHFVIVLSVLLFTASDYLFCIFKLLFVLLPFSICHCIVCPSIYGFWLPLWDLQASLCPFALFLLSLYCLSFYLRLLITSLVSSSLSLSFCPFQFVIVLSVLLLFTASDYLFGIFKLLFVLLPFFFCHCIVCPSFYGFWLPLWYLQASLCPFALLILSLYCLSFYLRLLIPSLVPSSFSLSFCPFHFVIVLSVLLLFTVSDYLFGTFKLLFVLLPFSFCHCIVCPSSIYGFWLPLLYLQASLCPFPLFLLSLYCLSFFYLRLLITSFVPSSFSLSFCPFHFVIVLSVLLLFTASDYLFGIFKLLFVLLPFFFCHCIVCPSSIYVSDYLFCAFKLLFVLLPFSFCHCIVCPSSIYGFWLPLWYLQASLCPFALFILSLYCLSFSYLRLLITSFVPSSFSLSFCPFHFVIVLSVLLLFTASDYLFGAFKLLFVPLPFSFCHCIVCPSSIYASDYLFGIFKLLFVLLPFFFCHCIVCPSSIYCFWLPLLYLQASLCPFALFILSLYCLSFFYLRLLIPSLVPSSFSLSFLPFSFCHCIVCPSSIYGFWLPLLYLQASLCPFALFILSLYCLSFSYLRLLITSFVPSSFSLSFCPFHFVIVLSVVLLFTASDYLFGTFKLLFVLLPFFFCHCIVCPSSIYASDYLFCTCKLLFVLLPFFFCHCIVCPSSIYGFWLPLWFLQASVCPFALFILSLYCLSFFYLRLLITSLVPASFSLSFCPFHFVIVLSVLLLFTASDYLFGIFKLLFVLLPFSFCHCIVCSSIYGFWLPLLYLQASLCPFALFILSLYCLSFFYLRFLITSFVPSSFSLSFCPFHFVIVLSVLLLFTASDYLFGIFKLLFVLLPFSFCHCNVCSSSIYGFWLPLWCLQASVCPFALFILSLYCLSFLYLRFWLPLWYLQASLCPFAFFLLSLYCLSVFYLLFLITSFVPSSFSLSFCPFHFVIVLSVLLLFTASDSLFGTFKLLFVLFALFILSLYCLSFFYLRLLITSFVPSSFSLSFCPFHFVIVLSVLLLFTASD